MDTQTIVGLASAAVAVAAALIAFLQVRTMYEVSHSELLYEMLQELSSVSMRQRRALMYRISRKEFDQWTREEYLEVEQVSIYYANQGFMFKARKLPLDEYLAFTDGTIARMYRIAYPLIVRRREEGGGPASRFVYFEWLARQDYLRQKRGSWWWGSNKWTRIIRDTEDILTFEEPPTPTLPET